MYFLQNDLINIEEVKKTHQTKQTSDRKEKLCDTSNCNNFAFPVVIESNEEFLVEEGFFLAFKSIQLNSCSSLDESNFPLSGNS